VSCSMISFCPKALKHPCGIVPRHWTTRLPYRNGTLSFRRLRRSTARHMTIVSGRAPSPPMPRVFPMPEARITDHSSLSWLGRIREWWGSGTILLTIGWSGVALLLVDQYLQYQMQDQQLDKEEMLEELVYNAQLQRQRLQEEYKNHKCLYKCIITNADAHMGGSHGLRNVQTGDVVEVLEERVGLGNVYHMCRWRRSKDAGGDEIGWFPIRYLERLPWWKRLFW
jgi:hypothetical protein